MSKFIEVTSSGGNRMVLITSSIIDICEHFDKSVFITQQVMRNGKCFGVEIKESYDEVKAMLNNEVQDGVSQRNGAKRR